MWLGTLSILGQVIYNLEISRYTLYTGEPIFTGKFRTPPGPMFWVLIYLLLDVGSIFPYLAATAASPLTALFLQRIPDSVEEGKLLTGVSIGIFLVCFIPLIVGGKIYNALKAIMTFKIVTVMGFLLILSLGWSTPKTWNEIITGFLKIGNVPVKRSEDLNHNRQLDPGEDWDGDGRLDHVEPDYNIAKFPPLDTDGDGQGDAWYDITGDDVPEPIVIIERVSKPSNDPAKVKKVKEAWPDFDKDGKPDASIVVDADFDGKPEKTIIIDPDGDGAPGTLRKGDKDGVDDGNNFLDIDEDGIVDGDNLQNIFESLANNQPFPKIDWSMIAFLSALVGVAGQGGLTNTPISNYTRDQGWGMGHHVGAIPSMFGGHNLSLSHEGSVFIVTEEALPRWKRWYQHIVRDQLFLWAPACIFGLALPSMLSVQFLPRGFRPADDEIPCMTAGGVQQVVGGTLGDIFWSLTLFCGTLVLIPTMASTIDGIVRRWVDVFWTSSRWLRKMEAGAIRYVYFGVLALYCVFGLTMLSLAKPIKLLTIATTIYNYALGFSCMHTLWLNHVLLPKRLQPGWFMKTALFLSGVFFLMVALLNTITTKW